MSQYEDVILEDKEKEENLSVDLGGMRHRIPWSERVLLNSEIPGLYEVKELLEDDDASCLAEEEDGVGCPLPSTPEDDHLLDCEVCIVFFCFKIICTWRTILLKYLYKYINIFINIHKCIYKYA